MMRMLDGGVEGFFVMGQNPAVGSQHAGLQRRRWPAQVAGRARPGRDRDGDLLARLARGAIRRAAPEDIQTEVFLMPAAAHVEKEGCFTNTQRLVQCRDKALEPPGDARSSCGSCTTWPSA
jgi:formate dehydrogenase major subunit